MAKRKLTADEKMAMSIRRTKKKYWKYIKIARHLHLFVWLFAVGFILIIVSLFPKGTSTGNKVEEAEIYDYLTSTLGYTPAAACGIMGNLKSESNFNPDNLQDKFEKILGYSDSAYTAAVDSGEYSAEEFIYDSAGYGLCQWTYDTRKEGLLNLAHERGVSIADYRMQLDYMEQELGDNNREYLMSLPDTEDGAYDAGYYFCEVFEKPKNDSAPKRRGAAAQGYYRKYAQ